MSPTTTVTITAPADALATALNGIPPPSLVDDPTTGVGHLYLEYADRLLQRVRSSLPPGLAGRTDPEDVVQSVFRRLIARYGPDAYAVPAGHDLWKLLLTIALNKIRDENSYHRANRRDVRRTRSTDSQAVNCQAEAEDTSLRMVIEELIAPLAPDRRAAVELRLAGYEFKEIAAKLGRSKRTIERYLQEFRDRLDLTLADTHY
jgi:RNA polymerase sigma factor (sigma-70 family)